MVCPEKLSPATTLANRPKPRVGGEGSSGRENQSAEERGMVDLVTDQRIDRVFFVWLLVAGLFGRAKDLERSGQAGGDAPGDAQRLGAGR